MRRLSSRARWAVPAGAVAVVGIVVAATAMANASEPSLPARTPVQLLTAVQQAAARPLSPQTATIQETANLGLPALPQIGAMSGQSGPGSSLNLLAGTTTIDLWYLNPTHLRIAEPTQMGESDLRLDGTTLWLWDSRTQTATHVLLPAQAVHRSPNFASPPVPPAAVGSPAAVARRLLAEVGPTTSVTVGPNVTVAGRSAYQLVIAPKAAGSLIGQVVIAIDASSHLPLRVQVFTRGSSSPAFQVGYTALSFGAPAASNFTFTPPSGAKVKTVTVPDKVPAGLSPASLGAASLGVAGLGPAGLGGFNPGGPMVGAGSAASSSSSSSVSGSPVLVPSPPPPPGPGSIGKVAVIYPGSPSGLRPATARQLRAALRAQLPKNMTKAQRAAVIKALGAKTGYAPLAVQPAQAGADVGQPRVIGSGWTSVLATPPSAAVAAAVQQLLSGHAAGSQTSTIYGYGASSGVSVSTESVSTGSVSTGSVSTGSVSAVSASPSPVPVGPDLAILQALLRASTPVSGSWGSGRLIRSALLTVLVTSKGQVLVGAVTPSVLYADVAALSR